MPIDDYKPFADEAVGSTGCFQDEFPLGGAIPNRIINNAQFILQNRLRRGCKVWDAGRTFDGQGATPTSPAAPTGAGLRGHNGNFGGSSGQTVPYTTGLQFSTHPAVPLSIPFSFPVSPGARFIDVYVTCKVEGPAGGLMASGSYLDEGAIRPMAYEPRADGLNDTNFTSTNMRGAPETFFTSNIRASDQYQLCNASSTDGTNGMSYYKVTIDISNRLLDFAPRVKAPQPINSNVVVSFQSGIDSSFVVRATNDTPLRLGNREIQMADSFSKYVGSRDPGAFHAAIEVLAPDTARGSTFHHVMAAYPDNPVISAYSATTRETYLVWPGVPANSVQIGSATDGNATAGEGTGFVQGDGIRVYDITKWTLYSVSIEERFS